MVTEVYDLEILSNLFTYTGFCLQTNTQHQFVIHKSRNDLRDLKAHLLRDKQMLMVGFNNERFDYPIIHYILLNYDRLCTMSGEHVANELYFFVQSKLIGVETYTGIWDKDRFIPQLDLYLIWHYNNKARLTSLKDLEFAMRMENVEEMPIHHSQHVEEEDIPLVLSYNANDVDATTRFLMVTLGRTDYSLYKGKDKIELRQSLSNKFNINCMNWPDVKIGEQLMLTLYSRMTGQDKQYVKNLSTPRPQIVLKDCIPHWAKFRTNAFQSFLNILDTTIINPEKSSFEHSVIFHDIKFDFGLGGAHGCIKAGVYESNDDWVIYDLDVASLYPSIAKSLQLYMAHLGIEFINLYSQFIDDRLAEKGKPKKERDNVLIEGYKLLLNGTYGKSNEKTSFLYDPLYTFKTTIGGQLFICMWAERMVQAVPELQFIQINTDGITIKIPRTKINLIDNVSAELTKETGLEVETVKYDKMVIRDVNNYCARYEGTDDMKYKGIFEIDKEYHKDSSMTIVPIALKNYFFNRISVEDTIRGHKNIYDFCMRLKINSNSRAIYSSLSDEKSIKELIDIYVPYGDIRGFLEFNGWVTYIQENNWIKKEWITQNQPYEKMGASTQDALEITIRGLHNSQIYQEAKHQELQRTTRYFISNTGGGLTVYYNGSKNPNRINKGMSCTLFNKFYESENYDINYKFYITETKKIIDTIVDTQQSLF